ncbi:hypothetical protein KOAAANKH_02567 [Brevundimonas sp. NIBR10]|uniref:hypothetical protein n=1 Tax=Brevundimonas sp. NIBR10 TaxID=3015997 RepID=UPI0022F14645|nr:hypothetical protein [Brevundimonas sp. NIBR10]WGM47685.1 hypothetical protein KOAAANKH_02567 [Brevundimonas sp. NIBR10]
MIAKHPLGVAYHPEWRNVRDRWNDRYCAQVMERAAEERVRTERPLISNHTLLSACAVIIFLMAVWAVGLEFMK